MLGGNTYDSDVDHGIQEQPPRREPGVGNYRFTPEEAQVLKECNTESFFQRSLPLGTILGLGTYSAIQRGMFRPSPRFGPFPKVTLAVIVGYFVGKLSYQQQCAEKLMALPGSYIGQLLRERKEGRSSSAGVMGGRAHPAPPSMFGAGPGDIYSDAGPGSALDLDTQRPAFGGDAYRPGDVIGEVKPSGSEDSPSDSPRLTYDEMRRRNRGEYDAARHEPYRVDPNGAPAVSRPPAPLPPHPPPPLSAHRPTTNKYGDVVD